MSYRQGNLFQYSIWCRLSRACAFLMLLVATINLSQAMKNNRNNAVFANEKIAVDRYHNSFKQYDKQQIKRDHVERKLLKSLPPTYSYSPFPTSTNYPSFSPSPSPGSIYVKPIATVSTPSRPISKPVATPTTVSTPSRPISKPVATPTTASTPSRPISNPVATPTTVSTPSRPISNPVSTPTTLSTPSTPIAKPVATPTTVSTPSVKIPTILVPIGVPVPISAPVPVPSCFSALNTVKVKGIGIVEISQLNIGDYVKGGNGKFTQVYGFGHFDHVSEGDFRQINFEDANMKNLPPLEITSGHLIFIERHNQMYLIPAADIVVGDVLSGKIVQSIRKVIRRGIYAPLTQSGDIVVSGIRASNYVEVLHYSLLWDQHTLGHIIFFPQRLFCNFLINTCKKETYVYGYGLLAYTVVRIGSFVNSYGWLPNLILSILSTPMVGFVYAIESLVSIGICYEMLTFMTLVIVMTIFHIRSRTR